MRKVAGNINFLTNYFSVRFNLTISMKYNFQAAKVED